MSYGYEVVDDRLLNEQITKGNVQIPVNTHVPFFIAKPDAKLNEEDELTLVEWCRHEIYGGVHYFKMDCTDMEYGKEPSYSSEVLAERVTLWQSRFGDAISAENMIGIRRWNSMTFEEKQAEVIAELKAEKNNVAFELEVYSSAKGEELKYTINLKSYSELQTQYSMGGAVATHDDSRTLHEVYTNEEAGILLYDIGKAVAERECIYDLWITRATMATDESVLDMVKNISLTEEEQAYIDGIVGGLG